MRQLDEEPPFEIDQICTYLNKTPRLIEINSPLTTEHCIGLFNQVRALPVAEKKRWCYIFTDKCSDDFENMIVKGIHENTDGEYIRFDEEDLLDGWMEDKDIIQHDLDAKAEKEAGKD